MRNSDEGVPYLSVCACSMDGRYRARHVPIVVDLPIGSDTRVF